MLGLSFHVNICNLSPCNSRQMIFHSNFVFYRPGYPPPPSGSVKAVFCACAYSPHLSCAWGPSTSMLVYTTVSSRPSIHPRSRRMCPWPVSHVAVCNVCTLYSPQVVNSWVNAWWMAPVTTFSATAIFVPNSRCRLELRPDWLSGCPHGQNLYNCQRGSKNTRPRKSLKFSHWMSTVSGCYVKCFLQCTVDLFWDEH